MRLSPAQLEARRALVRPLLQTKVAEFLAQWAVGALTAPPSFTFLRITWEACERLGLTAEAAALRKVALAELSPSREVH